jgi:hypothetical protein
MGGVGGFSAIGVASAAIGAAAGSAASQVVGMAAGVVDDFSWKAVAQSALSAGVSAGVGGVLHTAGILNSATTAANAGTNSVQVANSSGSWIAAAGKSVLTGSLSTAATQAIQGKWSWRDIAANAVGSAAGSVAGSAVGEALKGYEVGAFASRMASSLAGAAVAEQVKATDPNYTRASTSSMFVSSIGNAIGGTLVDAITPNDRNVSDSSYRNEMDRESDGYTPAAAYGYRNGLDIESDLASGAYLNREQEERLQSGVTVTDYGDDFADGDGLLAASTGARRRSGSDLPIAGSSASGSSSSELDIGPGLRVPGTPRGPALGNMELDRWGQPLNGRSDFNRFEAIGQVLQSDDSLLTKLAQLADLATYTTPDADQLAAEISAKWTAEPNPDLARIDRMRMSPVGAILGGTSIALGATEQTQDMLVDVGTAADGLLLAGAGLAGRVADVFGAQRPAGAPIDSPYALTSRTYLSGFTRLDKFSMGNRLESMQGLLDHYSIYEGRTTPQLYVRAFDASGNLLPGSVRLDRVGLRADGGYDLIDYKLSPNAPLTTNQGLHYPALAEYGGLVTGYQGRSIGLPQGRVLPPTTVEVKTGPALRLDR